MNNYLIIEKSFTYNGDLTLGKELTIKSHDNKVFIYNLEIQKVFISNKVYKKYLKLLKMVNFYLNSDDDTGTAYHEALNEIEKFRQLVKNKYRAYLLDETLKEMSLELQKKVIEAERAYLNSKTNDYQTNQNIKLNEAMELVSVSKEKLHSCEIVLKDYENKLKIINEKGKFNKTKNESLVNELEKLQLDLAEVINNPDKCPNCGYILNEEKQQEKIDNLKAKITNLNNQKASLIEDTKKLANDKNELLELIDSGHSDLSDLKADLSAKEANLDKVKGEPFNPISNATNALKDIYLELKEELSKLEEKHNNLEVEIETKYANDLTQINKELEPIMQAKYNLKLYKKTDKEKQELISQLNDAESSYTLCDEYIKTRIKAINDKAYSTFGIEFEMLKEQVNGGLEEVCYPVLDGKAYNQLNRGLKEYLGAKFITKIKELTSVKDMPILIDNAESLGSNSLNKIVNMGSQIIATRVVSNKNILELVKE